MCLLMMYDKRKEKTDLTSYNTYFIRVTVGIIRLIVILHAFLHYMHIIKAFIIHSNEKRTQCVRICLANILDLSENYLAIFQTP